MYFGDQGDDTLISPYGQLSIAGSILEHNVATSGCAVNCSDGNLTFGGAVYAGSALKSLTLHSLTMINNTAHYGGALAVWGHYDVSITDCEFHNNKGACNLAALFCSISHQFWVAAWTGHSFCSPCMTLWVQCTREALHMLHKHRSLGHAVRS